MHKIHNQEPVLDLRVHEEFLALMGGDEPEVAEEMVLLFLEDAHNLLQTMRQALAAGAIPEFMRSAHTLKSSSAQIGALSLSAHCKELEMMGKAGMLDQAAALMDRAEADYERVRAVLLHQE